MTLIKSISGIRGTIGGKPGEGLSPLDAVKFTSAFVELLKADYNKTELTIVVGRDGRISGAALNDLVNSTLQFNGANVIDLGLSTTPTVEMAVTHHNADGGIILTASHNPAQWNALKLLNNKGEFINAEKGEKLLQIAEAENFEFADVRSLGTYSTDEKAIERHIEEIIKLPYVDIEAIKGANFKIAFDAVNSTGGISIPQLLTALGVTEIYPLYDAVTGDFQHNPEPLPENLTEISSVVKEKGLDLGFVVDPDVDRLAVVNEDGSMFGEEYTLVAIADYMLGIRKGNTVSNLSSSRALRDVTVSHGGSYTASAVGEVNVVVAMKETNAVIGGEGNGGIILPDLHFGRDALVGIALFLSHLAQKKMKCSELKAIYPKYVISKNKIQLTPDVDVDAVLKKVESEFSNFDVSTVDGVKIDMPEGWVHLRKSNTEPIIRVYSEAENAELANELAGKVIKIVKG